MKRNKLFYVLNLGLLFLILDNTVLFSQALIKKSKNNWPMSGGPNGTWKIETKAKVQTNWSVRSNTNIKWKKTLPEGGQSGIVVWGDDVFFTINPPLNTPPYEKIKADYELLNPQYDELYSKQKERTLNDTELKFLKKEVSLKTKLWNDMLASDSVKKMSKRLKAKYIRDVLMPSQIGQDLEKAKANVNDYIIKSDPKLHQLSDAYEESKRLYNFYGKAKDIILYCVSAKDGTTKWTKKIEGNIEADYHYGFSDATTPSPICDGKYVWVYNATGGMTCLTMKGEVVWFRRWTPSPVERHKPFNRQFESILYGDFIFNIEPYNGADTSKVVGWNYLYAINKKTGKVAWISDDALTYYNTPVFGYMKDKTPAILIGRGGPHSVPERPVGLSMVSLKKDNLGKSIWRWENHDDNGISGYGALNTQLWNKDVCSWIYKRTDHCTVNASTGELIAKHPTIKAINQYEFDTITQKYVIKKDVPVENDYAFYSNVIHGDYVFYLTMYEPFLNRLNIKTGLFEKLELPTEMSKDGDKRIWKTKFDNDGLNAQGQKHYNDRRITGGGDQRHFHGSVITVNDFGFFTSALGITYVINLKEEDLSKALIEVNDVGLQGQTWCANSMSFANGNLFHRTMKELICIE